jgi:hypothetical protein
MHRRAFEALAVLTFLAALTPSNPPAVSGQEAGAVVGTIEIVTPGGTRTFAVLEGPPSEGFATGYNRNPVGEAWAFSFTVTGVEEGTGDELMIQSGVYQESMAQICDPLSNNVELHGEPGGRLREGGTNSSTCPSNTVDLDVTEASFDETQGTLHVVGTFSGPFAGSNADVEAGDAVQVTAGRFEATLRSFQDL